jgi:lysophospholipase L1-like esterase
MSRRPRGALLFVSLAVLVLTAEWRLKDHYYSQTYRYYDAGEVYWEDSHTLLLFSPDRYLFWRLKAGIKMKLEETPEQYGAYVVGTRRVPYAFEVKTDSRGYNSPEFDCDGSGDVFRIATLGDSRTMAEGVPFDDLYSRKLEGLLNRRPGGRRYEVINGGVSGYSSFQGLVELEREIAPCRPAVVTVLFGINDQDTDEGINDARKAQLFDSPLTTLRAWSNRSMIVYFLRREWWQMRASFTGKTPAKPRDYAGKGPRAARVSLEEYAQNLARIAELGRQQGFKPVFLILPTSPYAYYPELFPDQATEAPETTALLSEADTQAEQDPLAAAAHVESLLAQHPESSRAKYVLARCLQRLGRFEEANALFVEMNRSVVFSRYEAVVRRVAQERGVSLVDLTPEFTALRKEPLYVDDMHPNALGHEIVARRLYEDLVGAALVR